MGEKIPKKTPKIKSYNCDHCDKELSTKDAAKQHEATCGEGAQNKILTRYQQISCLTLYCACAEHCFTAPPQII